MENLEIYFALGAILGAIGQLLFVLGCIILVVKQKNSGTILMLVGSVLHILFSLGSYVWTLFAARQSAEAVAQSAAFQNIVGRIPFILIAIGLLLYVVAYVKKRGIASN